MCQLIHTLPAGLFLIIRRYCIHILVLLLVCVCVCVTIEMFLQYSIHSEEQGPAEKKGLLVLETIFSYPTRTGEELLHKNTSIRERELAREDRERGGGGERQERGQAA